MKYKKSEEFLARQALQSAERLLPLLFSEWKD